MPSLKTASKHANRRSYSLMTIGVGPLVKLFSANDSQIGPHKVKDVHTLTA